MAPCSFPNCPSGSSVKLLDERHDEIKGHLSRIESGQNNMISLMQSVAGQAVEIDNIKKDLEGNDRQHDEFFKRIRRVESKVIYFSGGCAGVVVIVEILRAVKVIP